MVERRPVTSEVAGSSPALAANKYFSFVPVAPFALFCFSNTVDIHDKLFEGTYNLLNILSLLCMFAPKGKCGL